MVSRFNFCRLLLAVLSGTGFGVTPAVANGTREAPGVDRSDLSPEVREESVIPFVDEMTHAQRIMRKQKWAALSPDERDQLRNQVREHWRQMTPEQRQRLRDVQYSDRHAPPAVGPGYREVRPPRFTPDERQQFRQWMRERRNGG